MKRMISFVLCTAFWAGFAPPVIAGEPSSGCDSFSWNMERELTLFGGSARPVAFGAQLSSAPKMETEMLYAASVLPQVDVAFVHAPGKPTTADDPRGGLATLHVAAAGRYRISVDAPFWLDVVSGGELIESNAFQGHRSCPLIHKSVEFSLPGNTDVVLQLSAGTPQSTRIAVTRVPGE